MTDSNYIPAAERQYALEVLEGSKPTGVLLITAQQNATMSALRSHVVADSVMHELAQALRNIPWMIGSREDQIAVNRMDDALRRYSALTKGEA